ncbi:MAG: class I SAM-dependent methyltransferase [Dietzia psychralcaliphila]
MSDLPQSDVYGFNRRPEMGKFIPGGASSILEVGCASGGFALTIRDELGSDCKVFGIDAVEHQVESARALGAFDHVDHGYFPGGLSSQSRRYDVIVFNDVLEHVVDPWELLRSAREYLSPGGQIVASIPNVQFLPNVVGLLRGRWEYVNEGILDRTHVRFFTRSSMVALFEEAGFGVQSIEGINSIAGMVRKFRFLYGFRPLLGDSFWQQFAVVTEPVCNSS